MKKTVFVLILLITATTIGAQVPVRLGVTGGINFNKYNENSDFRTSFHIGMTSDITLGSNFYLAPSLLFIGKGHKSITFFFPELSPDPIYFKKESYYLEMPVHVGYNIKLGNSMSFLVSAGPYFSLGLFGKHKNTLGDSQTMYKKGTGDKRFDMGLGGKIHLRFSDHYQLGVGYDWGILKTTGNDSDSKNRNLSVSVSYLF